MGKDLPLDLIDLSSREDSEKALLLRNTTTLKDFQMMNFEVSVITR